MGFLDKLIARWNPGNWTFTSLCRTGTFWGLFLASLVRPGLRVTTNRWSGQHPRMFAGISGLLILSFVICSLWPLNRIEWGLVDDHEILIEVNKQGRFTAADFIDKIQHHIELGGCFAKSDNHARFRPAYFFLRYLEVWLWQGNSHAWGRARIFLAGLALWIFFLALKRLTDPVVAGLTALSITTFSCWPDTWRYLGRNEIYASVGLVTNLYGFALLWGRPPRLPTLTPWTRRIGWGLMLLGFLIAIGSKENFIILIGPIGLVYLRNLWRRLPNGVAGHAVLILSLMAIVGLALVLKYKLSLSEGLDIYGRSTESSQRLSFLLPAVRTYFFTRQGYLILAISGIYLLLGFWSRNKGGGAIVRIILWEIVVALGISSAVFVSQYVFYVGALDNRYRFPAEFTWYLAAVGLGCCMTRSPRLRQLGLIRWRRMLWRGLFVLIAAPMLVLGPHRLTQETIVRVEQTRRFEKFLSQIARTCNNDSKRPLVIEATRVYAFEPAYAMPITLKQFGVANPLYLRYAPKSDLTETESPHMFRRLVNDLTGISRDGRFGYHPWPAGKESSLGQPFIIGLDSDEPVTKGDWLGRAPW